MKIPNLSIFFILFLFSCAEQHAQVSNRIDKIKQNEAKLDSIRIPALELSETPFIDALNLLNRKSVENDRQEKDINNLGVNIIASFANNTEALKTPISLKLSETSLRAALKATTNAAGAKFRVESNAVIVMRKRDDSNESLRQRTYRVALAFPEPRPAVKEPVAPASAKTPKRGPNSDPFGGGGGGGEPDPFGASSKTVVSEHWTARLDERKNAVPVLTKNGTIFGKGATATYNQKTSILTVKNTALELARVQQMVDHINLKHHLKIHAKLEQIRIPSLEFDQTELNLALAFLSSKSSELDFHESYRYHKGIGFFVDPESSKAFKEMPITIRLTNIPLGEALRYIVELAGAKHQISTDGIKVFPR